MSIIGDIAGGIGALSNLGFGIYDRINQKNQQNRDKFYKDFYGLLDLQQFENVKDMQQWQKDIWSKEYEYNKSINDRNYDLARNATIYRAQDLVNAGMSPLLAAGGAAMTPSMVSAPSAPSMPSGSGRGGSSPSAPSVGSYVDAFTKFAELRLQSKLVDAQADKLRADAYATRETTPGNVQRTAAEINRINQDIKQISARTGLTEAQTEEALTRVSNIKADTLLKFANTELSYSQRDRVIQDFKNLQLTNQQQRILIDYSIENGVPPQSVNSDLVKSIMLAKLYSDFYNNKKLTSEQRGLLQTLVPNLSTATGKLISSGVASLFSRIRNKLYGGD